MTLPVQPPSGRATLLFIAGLVVLCAALSAPLSCGGKPGPAPAPSPAPVEPAPRDIDIPADWDPTPEEIAKAPTEIKDQIDPYTVVYYPYVTRDMLEKKAELYRLAVAFFKGPEAGREQARKKLADLGLPTAKWLRELAGILVPKEDRPAPDPESWDPIETPEDKALEVVKDIQAAAFSKGDLEALMHYFVAATGKTIEMDAKLAGRNRTFEIRRVHPIPALWRVGDMLGCDMAVVDPDSDRVRLFLPVLLDMKIHGEDLRWLLESMARLGGFESELGPQVKGPISFRVRAGDYEEAFRVIAERAGCTLEKKPGGYRVSR